MRCPARAARLGIERVRLAVAAAGGTVRAVHFDHGQAVVGQESQQPGTEAARALHPDLVHLPRPLLEDGPDVFEPLTVNSGAMTGQQDCTARQAGYPRVITQSG